MNSLLLGLMLFFDVDGACVHMAPTAEQAIPPPGVVHTAEVTGAVSERLNLRMAWLSVSNGVVLDAGAPITEKRPKRAAYRALLGTNRYADLRRDARAAWRAAATNEPATIPRAQWRAAWNAVRDLEELDHARAEMRREADRLAVKPEDDDQ